VTAFAVSLEALADVVERLAAFDRSVETALGELDARIARLHATWTGAAADEQRAAHGRWSAGARDMREAVVALRRIASTAHGNYSAAAAANRRMWA
jgi:WXG100 family type VII secretion target